jgi:23S rRNA (guanine745-N1)-methyltransferase
MYMELICPLCGEKLNRDGRVCQCENRHSFDVPRQGYVNLLTVQQKHSLNPGDTKEQVLSRRGFLDGGFYKPIVDTLIAQAKELGAAGPILDAGCGEGYYSSRLADALGAELLGLDISKDAVRCAAGKYKNALWVCGTAAKLPVESGSIGLLCSLFAVTLPEEFHRCLRKNGLFFQVLAAQDHLLGLKRIIYPELKLREKDSVPELSGFVWRDILRIAAYRQHNAKIPATADCCSTGRLRRGYGVEPMLQLLTGNRGYRESHNALLDAMDELEIMRRLGCPACRYPTV